MIRKLLRDRVEPKTDEKQSPLQTTMILASDEEIILAREFIREGRGDIGHSGRRFRYMGHELRKREERRKRDGISNT